MKIWCTYYNAGGLHAGGLERVRVWFTKPIFIYQEERDKEITHLPFGGGHQRQGIKELGWVGNSYERGEKKFVSFGKVFGYGDDFDEENKENCLAFYVWDKLSEHFGSDNLSDWMSAEKNGIHSKDFLLEIDLDVNFKIKK